MKINKLFKNKLTLYTLTIFLFFLTISLLMPYGGDDWNNLLAGNASFIQIIDSAIANYQTFEGRFFSRIAVSLLVPNQFIWAVLHSAIIASIFYIIVKIINPKNKIIIPILVFILLFLDSEMFAQIYVWKTGSITYLFPMIYFFVILFYKKDIFNDNLKKDKWWAYILFPILALVFCMFVENVSVAIIMLFILIIVYSFMKHKFIDKLSILCLIFSIIGLFLMLSAPGTSLRLDTTGFADLNVFEKIIYNISNFINYTYIHNGILLMLFSIVLCSFIFTKVSNKFLKIFLYLFVLVIPFFTLIASLLTFIMQHDIRIIWRFLDPSLWYIKIYWILYTVLLIYYFINHLLKTKDSRVAFFLILAISNTGAMFISPIWGGRTSFFTVLMLYIVILLIFEQFKIKNEKILSYILNICICLFMVGFIFYSCYCNYIDKLRKQYIDYQLNNNYKVVEVILMPKRYTWNASPWGTGWLPYTFKKVMGIPDNVEIKLIDKKDARS